MSHVVIHRRQGYPIVRTMWSHGNRKTSPSTPSGRSHLPMPQSTGLPERSIIRYHRLRYDHSANPGYRRGSVLFAYRNIGRKNLPDPASGIPHYPPQNLGEKNPPSFEEYQGVCGYSVDPLSPTKGISRSCSTFFFSCEPIFSAPSRKNFGCRCGTRSSCHLSGCKRVFSSWNRS